MRLINLSLIIILGFIEALLLNGCGAYNAPTDESDLQQVANYDYQPGKTDKLSHAVLHDYLSEKSKDLITFEAWDKSDDADAINNATAVSLLGPQNNAGQTYQVVSVTVVFLDKEGKKHRMTYSDTWTLESGKWKRLSFLPTKADYQKAFQSGDFVTAQQKAQDWLALNPYSIEANQSLGFAMIRASAANNAAILSAIKYDEALPEPPMSDYVSMVNFYESIGTNEMMLYENLDNSVGSKVDEIVNNMIAINPNDSITVFCASNWYQSEKSKEEFLLKMKNSTSDSDDIFDFASNIHDMHFRFTYLSGYKETPGILLLELEAYAVLAEVGHSADLWDLYRKFEATKGTFEAIKPALDNMASSDAAQWAGKIGDLLYNSKDYDYAQQLLDLSLIHIS